METIKIFNDVMDDQQQEYYYSTNESCHRWHLMNEYSRGCGHSSFVRLFSLDPPCWRHRAGFCAQF